LIILSIEIKDKPLNFKIYRRIKMPNQKQSYKPGENCPASGEYELMDSNGQGTGAFVTMEKGNRFPPGDKEGQTYTQG
jgi:hypothetical protein